MDTIKACVLKEIGLCSQTLITILGAIDNIIGGHLHDHLLNTKNVHFEYG